MKKSLIAYLLFKLPLLRKFTGITLPWGVYYNPRYRLTPRIIKHEAAHVMQIKRLGAFKFYYMYLKEYALNMRKYKFNHMKAYLMISFEQEARRAEGR